jgi:hypothetical protein
MWHSNLRKKISFTNIDTLNIALPMHRNPQHRSLLTVDSATSAPHFQPLRHQRNVCHPVVNCFTRQTHPGRNFFVNILCIESFFLPKTDNKTLLFGSIALMQVCHFVYWYLPLNMRFSACYLDCHEAGLCCYLVIHIENLLRPLQLFYFHLWPIYWLSLVEAD